MTTTTTARETVADYLERVAPTLGSSRFDLPEPLLWENIGGTLYPVTIAHTLDEIARQDVYCLLRAYASARLDEREDLGGSIARAFVVVTSGWAAPLNENGEPENIAPSQHQARRRVSLAVAVSCDGSTCSALDFQDGEGGTLIEDATTVSGSLASALDFTGWAVFGSAFVVGLASALGAEIERGDERQAERLRERLANIIEATADDDEGVDA